jgi:hypothetical protein
VTWSPLPDGEALELAPGQLYAVVASVKANHTTADIQAIAAGKGLTLTDYAEEGQRAGLGPDPRAPDYRYVAAIAVARSAGSIPWGVPWPLSMFDDSHVVRAWTSPPGPLATNFPPAPAPKPDRSPSMAPLLLVFAAGGALYAWRGRRSSTRIFEAVR